MTRLSWRGRLAAALLAGALLVGGCRASEPAVQIATPPSVATPPRIPTLSGPSSSPLASPAMVSPLPTPQLPPSPSATVSR